ncbi:MAG TPA: hypothetical protein VIV40_25775 [Kofleriaceae bacterium]
MPGQLAHVAMMIQCPHFAAGQVTTTNTRVKVSGQYVALQGDQVAIAGCPFTTGSNPSPCVLVKWLVPATRVKVMGQPVLLKDSKGLCQNPAQAPQGAPDIKVTQMRAKGT